MKTILVATDFSATAMNAANYAVDMAKAIDAEVLLLHVYNIPVIYSEMPVVGNEEELRSTAEEDIAEVKQDLVKRAGPACKIVAEVRMGNFFEELRIVCKRTQPYAVIMGSQGTTAAERLLFGSHTVYALRHLLWPLITVPPNAQFKAIKKIALACDFESVIETIPVDEIKTLARDFNAELQVVNTGNNNSYNPDLVFGSGMLQEMLQPLQPTYHLITNDNTDEGIMNFAEENQIDLLLVIPKRQSLLDKLMLHRSHSREIILHSHVPVMALHC